MDHDEPVWNAEAHNPLRSKGLRGLDPVSPPTLVDFTLCTTAAIIKEYLTVSGVDKRIDFCMYIDASADAAAPHPPAAIDDLRTSLPQSSINHNRASLSAPTP
ncbi:hypothetical protein ISF_04647 [Cordyceps fumosorosea ARSEF 2679]|uniref:PD-(D/E)XK nuclease-like domain-containing protein n=1 Tax=Cordyceps fumosorosea (strain ARSEF 2679) TaxID=1081104 RepID=A0A167WLH8_CORFA|nr:hypothetical protein ISF_04647 [Cordyceps fumosorosea ARSEF 2679]OAA63938.1 hypothetical protein ISF_04647 [Cordyceps fumosorosea ARSEF 2679]